MKNLEFLRMSPMVEKAYEIASKAHAGTKDKGGEDYINHPIAVAAQLVEYGEKYVSVALMHDVIEDTDVTINDLEGEFPADVIDALSLLTHAGHYRTHEEYMKAYVEYVMAIKESGNDIALKVKLADLNNNMDISRIPNPTEKDYKRIEEKYKPAVQLLSE